MDLLVSSSYVACYILTKCFRLTIIRRVDSSVYQYFMNGTFRSSIAETTTVYVYTIRVFKSCTLKESCSMDG